MSYFKDEVGLDVKVYALNIEVENGENNVDDLN
jgi:hypothetical protein